MSLTLQQQNAYDNLLKSFNAQKCFTYDADENDQVTDWKNLTPCLDDLNQVLHQYGLAQFQGGKVKPKTKANAQKLFTDIMEHIRLQAEEL
ncbi:MAG: hypothetical protein MI749_02875 [Desulfovibrionales bacterium]|nr:hypothetical protein [Desulfovibrionales bacterium]